MSPRRSSPAPACRRSRGPRARARRERGVVDARPACWRWRARRRPTSGRALGGRRCSSCAWPTRRSASCATAPAPRSRRRRCCGCVATLIGAGGRARAGARAGERGRGRGFLADVLERARSPTAATSWPAATSWAPTSPEARSVIVAARVPAPARPRATGGRACSPWPSAGRGRVERGYLAAAVELKSCGARQRRTGGRAGGGVPGAEADVGRARGPRRCTASSRRAWPASRSPSARSRPATDPADLHRAGAEALLAANVAVAAGHRRSSPSRRPAPTACCCRR